MRCVTADQRSRVGRTSTCPEATGPSPWVPRHPLAQSSRPSVCASSYWADLSAKDQIGDRPAGQRHEQPDCLVEQRAGDRRIVVNAIRDEHPCNAANRPEAGGQGKRSTERADHVGHRDYGETGNRVRVDGEEGAPQDEYLESEVGELKAKLHPRHTAGTPSA